MDPALLKTATEAARVVIETGVVGAILILETIAFVAYFILTQRSNARLTAAIVKGKDDAIQAERGFRAEVTTINKSVFEGLETLKGFKEWITTHPPKGR